MQTPLQELISQLTELHKIQRSRPDGEKLAYGYYDAIAIVKTLLEKEKQMIIDAYNNVKPDYLDGNKIDGEEFFKEVYDGKI